jgi:hypothetical protein
MRFRTLALLSSVAVFAPGLHAQAGAVLRGRVVEADSGGGVGQAQVSVDARPAAVADDQGRFVIGGLAPGAHTLHVARIGYDAQDVDVTVADSLSLVVSLAPRPREVAGVDATGEAPVPERLAGFAYRRSHHAGGARFLTRRELEVMRATTLAQALRHVPGVQLLQRGGGTYAVGRQLAPFALSRPAPCFAQVFVDGTEIYAPGSGGTPPNLDTFSTDVVEALEYYDDPAATPAEFRNAPTCGTLLIWTRSTA